MPNPKNRFYETRPLSLRRVNERDLENVPASCHYYPLDIFFNFSCGVDLVGGFSRSIPNSGGTETSPAD